MRLRNSARLEARSTKDADPHSHVCSKGAQRCPNKREKGFRYSRKDEPVSATVQEDKLNQVHITQQE